MSDYPPPRTEIEALKQNVCRIDDVLATLRSVEMTPEKLRNALWSQIRAEERDHAA